MLTHNLAPRPVARPPRSALAVVLLLLTPYQQAARREKGRRRRRQRLVPEDPVVHAMQVVACHGMRGWRRRSRSRAFGQPGLGQLLLDVAGHMCEMRIGCVPDGARHGAHVFGVLGELPTSSVPGAEATATAILTTPRSCWSSFDMLAARTDGRRQAARSGRRTGLAADYALQVLGAAFGGAARPSSVIAGTTSSQ